LYKIFQMKPLGLALLLVILSTFCSSKKSVDPIDLTSSNTPFEAGAVMATITNELFVEASGLAESLANPGYLWTHNDSGDEARLFLIDKTGNLKSEIKIANVPNRDWEDIAIGPGPVAGKNYIYIGDIGDNASVFTYKYIYRIEEPTIDVSKVKDTTIQYVDIIKFEYPDGLRDAESLMLDPLTKDLFVISKRELQCNVYRLPFPQSITESTKAELAIEKIVFEQTLKGDTIKNGDEILIKGYHPKYYYQLVAAAISSAGDEILIKSYSSVYYWKRRPNETVVDAIKRSPVLLPYQPEPQGEAISFMDSTGYFTINERMKDKEQKLIFYKRKN
jgi:hypothetical protein